MIEIYVFSIITVAYNRLTQSTLCWHIYLITKILPYEPVEKRAASECINPFVQLFSLSCQTLFRNKENVPQRRQSWKSVNIYPLKDFAAMVFVLAGGYSCRFRRSTDLWSRPSCTEKFNLLYSSIWEQGRSKGSGYVSGSGFNRVPGSVSWSGFAIRIRIRIQEGKNYPQK